MKPLRRSTTTNQGTSMVLELDVVCDQCGNHRAHGNHRACSKKRQAQGVQRRLNQEARP